MNTPSPTPEPKKESTVQGPTPINAMLQKQFMQSIVEVRKDWDTYLELFAHQARMTYAKFEAAKDAGFTEPQALEICVKSWM